MSGIDDVIALSPLQEGLFSLAVVGAERDGDVAQGGDVYTIPLIIDISGPLDVAALRLTLTNILIRHPNLRAIFWDTDVAKPVQIVPTDVTMPWYFHEFTEEEADRFTETELRRVFDLRDGPSLRFNVIRLPDVGGERRHRLVVTVHHILMDGWSLGVFFSEMLQMYSAGGDLGVLSPVRPYRDYIAWLANADQDAMLAGWSRALDRLSGPLMFADTAGAGLDVAQAPAPVASHYTLDATHTAALSEWARTQGITLNTAVQFAWTLMLSRLTDRTDVVYGTVVTGRPHQVPDADRMIGLFLNTIPVPFTLDPTADVAAECRRLQRESSALRDIGYVGLSAIQRAAGYSSLFDTMFVFQNAPMDSAGGMVAADGVTFAPAMAANLTHYPLTVVAHLLVDELIVAIEAIEEKIPVEPATLAELFLGTLRRLPATPAGHTVGQLDIVGGRRRAALIDESSTSAVASSTDTADLFELFARHADTTPSAVALTDGDVELTYRDLHARALRLARLFGDLGVWREDFVGLCLPRSIDSVVAILAAFAAGAAYAPVDLALPDSRVRSILAQTRPVVVVVDSAAGPAPASVSESGSAIIDLSDPRVQSALADGDPAVPVPRRRAQAAYAIFTSGSTGEPKGVVDSDAAVASYFADHRRRVYEPARTRLGRPLRIAHAWSLSFDASWQPLVGLFDGHAVHLFGDEAMRDTEQLVAGIAAQRIDMIDTTPSMFRQLARAGLVDGYADDTSDDATGRRGPLSVLALGGEAIDEELWNRLRALTGVAVHNCYGPTEATVEAVVADVTGAESTSDVATIGRPTAGMTAYVLDSGLRPVSHGVTGELYLAGPQLARGYLGRAGQTAERFVADPFVADPFVAATGEGIPRRMYRTGDLVRRSAGGALVYLGRADDQVKVRGFRIEIGEIETALRAAPGVRDGAAVVVRRAGGAGLVGFVVPIADGSADPVGIRMRLAQRLPSYMIPARLLVLAELPVTSNGKLDARALTALAHESMEVSASAAQPSTPTERELSAVLAEVFGGAAPGVDEDFFDLGLDSIVAISLASAARAAGLAVSVRMIASAPTIRDLAAAIDAGVGLAEASTDGDEVGEVIPLPYPAWMFGQSSYRRLSHTIVLNAPADCSETILAQAVTAVLDTHGVLRSAVVDTDRGPRQVVRERGTVTAADVLAIREFGEASAADTTDALRAIVDAGVDEIDPRTGHMVQVTWVRDIAGGDLLVVTIHHLAVDVVSWSVLIPALAHAYNQAASGQTPELMGEVTSYRRWCAALAAHAESPEVLAEEGFWYTQLRDPDPALGRPVAGPVTWGEVAITDATISAADSAALLRTANRGSGVRELLLTALTLTLMTWRASRGEDASTGALVALESHGRSGVTALDPSTTVGWFTTVYPIRLGGGAVDAARVDGDASLVRDLHDAVVRQLAAVPGDGLGYGLLRDVVGVPTLRDAAEPQVEFNYLGRFDLGVGAGGAGTGTDWSMASDPAHSAAIPSSPEPDFTLRFGLNLVTAVRAGDDGPELATTWRWSEKIFTADQIDELAQLWRLSVAAVSTALDVTETRSL